MVVVSKMLMIFLAPDRLGKNFPLEKLIIFQSSLKFPTRMHLLGDFHLHHFPSKNMWLSLASLRRTEVKMDHARGKSQQDMIFWVFKGQFYGISCESWNVDPIWWLFEPFAS